jgi:hypothetical protein
VPSREREDNAAFSGQLSFCLSRACLGKQMLSSSCFLQGDGACDTTHVRTTELQRCFLSFVSCISVSHLLLKLSSQRSIVSRSNAIPEPVRTGSVISTPVRPQANRPGYTPRSLSSAGGLYLRAVKRHILCSEFELPCVCPEPVLAALRFFDQHLQKRMAFLTASYRGSVSARGGSAVRPARSGGSARRPRYLPRPRRMGRGECGVGALPETPRLFLRVFI